MSEENLDRRDLLEAALDAAEDGTLETPIEKDIEMADEDNISKESAKEEISAHDNEETSQDADSIEFANKDEAQEEEAKPVSRPSTWKKEYVQIWDKMEAGEQISKEDFTKFAEYANQRESEYKKGVSTYKAEADRARAYEDAIAPFADNLQKKNINPAL